MYQVNNATSTERKNLPTNASRPVWPPPIRPYKRRSWLKSGNTIVTLVASILVAGLLLSSIGFIIFTTTTHYRSSLRTLANVEMRQTQSVQGTTQAISRGTAQYFSSAQANIEATATAQNSESTLATQVVDNVTATATAAETRYQALTGGTPFLSDPMTQPNKKSQWDLGGTTATGCLFEEQVYHVREAQRTYLQPCIAQGIHIQNVAYQADMTILQGMQAQAGLLFRVDNSGTAYYFFHLGTDGSYALELYNGPEQESTLLQGTSDSINSGFKQVNQLLLIADATHITILVNKHYLATLQDRTLTEGRIGVGVINNSTPADVSFTNIQLWQVKAS